MRAIGSSIPRIDAWKKVTGEALYPGDIELPGMVHMKVLFAGRPHARIRHIDTSEAETAPGVLAVLTAKDVPVNEYGLLIPDQPVLCGPGSDKEGADVVRFVGDQVALVVAETPEQAEAALQLIQVEYEDLPVVGDVEQALAPDAPRVHGHLDSNVLKTYRIRTGDVEEGFAQADVIVEETFRTGFQEHAYLQPEAGVAYVDEEERIVVITAGQWTHEDRQQIAHALGMPEDRIVVRYAAIGGAFGGREDMSVQIILALAAWRLHQQGIHRPVKIVWSREESIIGHHKRHAMIAKARWGARKDGTLVAVQIDLTLDAGAYAYTSTKVLGNATLACVGPYQVPNVWVDTRAVYTNNPPSGAFRGFGGPQGHFIAETMMNLLAEALDMDPVELRMRNVLQEGSLLPTQAPVPPGCTMPQVLERLALEAGWTWDPERGWQAPPPPTPAAPEARAGRAAVEVVAGPRLRGRGLAIAYKNVGFSYGFVDECHATVELHGAGDIERVVVRHAGADVGQGAHTVMAQFAAEALDVPLEKITLIVSHTGETDNSGSSSASRMTFMAGNAIKRAAEEALRLWREEEARPAIAHYRYIPRPTTPYDPETGRSDPNITYGYVGQVAEVEVDPETGHVYLTRVITVDDVGRAVNPQQVEGQIEGSIAQAFGWTVMEDFQVKEGRVLTDRLSTYLIPTIQDVPEEMASVIMEFPDPQGPYGARGMGEMPFIPLPPAIIAAVRQATGKWFTEIPLTPERVWRALHGSSEEGD